MAVSATSAVYGLKPTLSVTGDPGSGLTRSSGNCMALRRIPEFGAGAVVVRSRKSLSSRASAGDEVNSKDPKGRTTKTEEKVPSWAKAGSDELPPWAKSERPPTQEPAQDLPFAVYLIGSSLVAIAAVGSIFEYFNGNPIFGIVQPDSPLWAPILGIFSITGLPSAGFLFYKGVKLANKASEDIDREDGFGR
ncbi:hypothetical protein R1sor_011368 [Riccia sorocarpa]|uniref:Photosystem I reaction center subunit VIII n=1 Tax=Riccia sorocarpa TaxID=122646 RepID=A0ABD3I0N8_9MARC